MGSAIEPGPPGSAEESVGSAGQKGRGFAMIYSYTQMSQYLTCPRRYRYRYLDGWQEKDLRAAMLYRARLRAGHGGTVST